MKPVYRLKSWVVTGIYLLVAIAVGSSFILLNKVLNEGVYSNETLSYVYRGLFDNVRPVVNYNADKVIKPFDSETVEISKNFYDKDASSDVQEQSLIMYQNTYMPNTGILYKSSEEFDVINVLDGTVSDIVADEVMGNIVTVKHSNNLATVYQCLNEVNVLIGDLLKQGDVIGTSGSNKIESDDNMLLFEVVYNGEYMNPENFYKMNIQELD